MSIIQSVDWGTVGKTWGPLGIVFVIFILGLIAIAKFMIKQLNDTIADARSERNLSREALYKQSEQFTASLKYRDDKMAEQFNKIIEELRETPSSRRTR